MTKFKILACCAIVAGSLAIAIPAGAHNASITGTASCSDGSHLVTWSITNGLATKTMSITATSAVSGVAYGVGIATNPVPGGGTTTATTVVPGSVTGDIVLTVVATWPDNFTRTETATVGLPDACAATTTTTTAPPTTTTPTTAPQGVLGVSTSVPTTAPTAVAGVECGPTTLACTGSSDTGSEVAIGFGMLIVGAGLVALKRRPTRTA